MGRNGRPPKAELHDGTERRGNKRKKSPGQPTTAATESSGDRPLHPDVDDDENPSANAAKRAAPFLSEALVHLRQCDPTMTPLIDRHGPPACFLGPSGDPFHALCRTVVFQQLAGKAAATIFARLTDLYLNTVKKGGENNIIPGAEVILTPEPLLALSIEELRSVGLSNQKANYVQNVARYFVTAQVGTLSDPLLYARISPSEIPIRTFV
eukprot:645610-Pyramimonas_sp.AAC.3